MMARSAVQAGHSVAFVARDQSRLDSSVDGLPADQVLTIKADVTNWSDMSAAVDTTVDRFGRLDAAVANAGVAHSVSFFGLSGTDPADWGTMVNTNVLGSALTARAALPSLVETKGNLVFIGSISGRTHRPGLYSATKWSVTAMAASIRAEAVGTGVRVTIVQPGVIDTSDLRDDLQKRPKLNPEVVANAVLYAIGQPESVDVNEIVLRPVGQPADC